MSEPEAVDGAQIVRDCSESFTTFMAHMRVERAGGPPQSFGALADQWQWDLVDMLAGPVEWLADRGIGCGFDSLGIRKAPERKHIWIELPKKHNKTTFAAAMSSWLLQNASRRLNIHVAAANRQVQAKLVRDQIAVLVRLNPELLDSIRVPEVADIKGRSGTLRLLAADESTTQGGLPHFTICDEVTVWNQLHGENLWSTLHSNWVAHQGLFLVLSNAGYEGSWQEREYRKALEGSVWNVYTLQGKHATWISDEAWEIIRSHQTPQESRRVCDNKWTSTQDEPLFTSELVEAMTYGWSQ